MSAEKVSTKSLSNGLAVIVEEMSDVESIAYDLLIPGGIITDPASQVGRSLILAELTTRGAGGLSSRELSDAFDAKGIRHSEGAGHERFGYRGSLLAGNLEEALKLVSHMVRNPELPENEIEPIRSVLLQDIMSLHDNPSRWAMVELSKRYYPAPYNRPSMGDEQGLKSVRLQDLTETWKTFFAPRGSVLSIAGKCSAPQVFEMIERYFGSWKGETQKIPTFGAISPFSKHHVPHESAQLQIVLSHPSAPFGSEHYFAAKVALGILSGGMFGRLFIEVREKRGLVYSVHAGHSSTKSYGTVTAYAGTTPERAHETLEVMLTELKGLRGSTQEDELQRSKANLKASLVIGQEASSARASANANDWWLDKRVRTLDEILQKVEAVTKKSIDAYLDAYPMEPYTLLTLGSREI